MAMCSRVVLAASALLMTGACNTLHPQTGSPDPAFGEALKYDMAIQVINPDPVYDDKGAVPGGSGAKGAEAHKRYRTDRVKDVRVMSTTSAGGESGDGGPK